MPVPGLKIALTPCESSRICAHGYDQASNTLALQFLSKGAPGPVYHYSNVEPELYEDLKRAPSIGKFFEERVNVKVDDELKYSFKRIEETKDEDDVAQQA